jgi:two-component system CheB/CheR fusion protein
VVGIGTSAGGLAAVTRFLEALPAKPGMAFVVVMHLSPRHDSMAAQILQRSTGMRVLQVTKPVPLRKDEVYVISPRSGLSMNDGYLRLVQLDRPQGKHIAIDFFFRTLAEVHREHAIAVILTGTGSDGSVGIARIRERGGITLAQHPDDAEYDQMPRAAIATGAVDIVLPLAELPDRILLLAQRSERISMPELGEPPDLAIDTPTPSEGSPVDEDALRDIMMILRAKTNHDFRSYKRATVLRRIERRMQVNGLTTLEQYRDLLHDTPKERPALLKDMLISVTNFFRDREAFEALERSVLPELLASTISERHLLRAWCAGCATGEEAYSVAMLLAEVAAPAEANVQVFATDIDDDAISHARQGVYPSAVITDIPPSRVTRFLTRDDNSYRINKSLRESILFARHNVLQDPPFSKLDLITCRNLLIYLNRDVQSHILEMFHFALRPGGYLFLGSSESADVVSKLFTPVDKKNRIYRANAVERSGFHLPSRALQKPPQFAAISPAQPSAHERQARTLADIHRRAVEDRLPPSMLVDREGYVVHMSENAGAYLRITGGSPSYQAAALVIPQLRLELRATLFRAAQEGRAICSLPVRIEKDGKALSVSVEAMPVRDQKTDAGYQLLVFHEQAAPDATISSDGTSEQAPLLLQLEDELKRSKERLQVTVEESETAAEELKASNEELQSINEELRSATEELETSKEELQSINEELITVNHELKLKVDETAKINDDLQNLVASTDLATVFVDRNMCIKRFTPRAADVFRLIAGDVGRSLLDLNHSLDYADLASDAEQAFHLLRTIDREVGSQDGRWYIARILPYRTAEDRIEGAVLTFIDITRRRNAEQAARSSEERMRLVADSAVDYAIITTDPDGIITMWSRGAERIFRYSAADAIGLHADLIFTAEDRSSGGFRREMTIAGSEGRANDDRWHVRSDGQRIFCSGITTPLRLGGFHGYAKIARDVTEEKQRESEREELLSAEKASREEAQSAITLKDEFLAVMSHELKHPLNLILMNAELVGRSAASTEDPVLRRAADAIRRTVEGQAQIIDDLLDLSRVNTGKLALNLGPVNVSECVRRITDGMGENLARRRISLELMLPADDLVIMADATRIEQVVWNLLSNALKFSRDGGQIRVVMELADDTATLRIEDNGTGMTPDLVARVFEMFEQGPDRRDRTGGLGIGLALVRHLVELHGGTVVAESKGPDEGSVFTLVIPRHASTARDSAAAPPPPFTGSILQGKHILIVDDSAELLVPFAELLTMEGATVSAANSGAEALQQLDANPIEIVLSDIGMPDMDGHELIRRVRGIPGGRDVIAVALTGFGRQVDQRKALQAGFDAHLSKPVSMSALTKALSRLYREKAQGAGLESGKAM